MSAVTFPHLVRSEWIKLRTLRSTFWCSIIILVLSLALAALLGLSLDVRGAGSIPSEQVQSLGVTATTISVQFTSLVAAVLGALMVTGEFGTGMIRSTFTAAPGRLAAVIAKSLVVAASVFVLGAASLLLSLAITGPLLGSHGLHLDLGDGDFWLALLGGALYLALITLFAFWVGVIIRNSAGAIATTMGVVFVLPILVSIAAGVTRADWITNAGSFLLTSAGGKMVTYPVTTTGSSDLVDLNGWQGGLVMLAWVAVVAVIGGILVRRRDV